MEHPGPTTGISGTVVRVQSSARYTWGEKYINVEVFGARSCSCWGCVHVPSTYVWHWSGLWPSGESVFEFRPLFLPRFSLVYLDDLITCEGRRYVLARITLIPCHCSFALEDRSCIYGHRCILIRCVCSYVILIVCCSVVGVSKIQQSEAGQLERPGVSLRSWSRLLPLRCLSMVSNRSSLDPLSFLDVVLFAVGGSEFHDRANTPPVSRSFLPSSSANSDVARRLSWSKNCEVVNAPVPGYASRTWESRVET